MPRRLRRVSDLAVEAGLDLDEVLVALWDAGIEGVDGPRDQIPSRHLLLARRALGLTAPKELVSVDHWVARTGLSRGELTTRARDAGVEISPSARRLPKGGVRRLSRLFPDVGVEPPTLDSMAVEPMRWELVGPECQVRCLTEDEVRRIHERLEEDYADSDDPIWPPGVKSENLLSSAVSRQHTGLGDVRKYPTLEMTAAALFHSLALNHAFHNGNKRTALVSMLAQLDENGRVLTATEQELFRFTLRTAQHGHVARHADQLADREVMIIARWIRSNSRVVDKVERPLKWVRLKQRLAEFDCWWDTPSRVGNRINIYRDIPMKRRFGVGSRQRRLHTQVASSGDGSEADRSTIHKIRRDLELDPEHGIDSTGFYAGTRIDSYILEYRKILDRLAKL